MTIRPASGITRRRALTGTATVGVAAPLLAACGSDGTTATDPAGDATSSSDEPTSSSSDTGGGDALASTSDVPVGGCFVASAAKVVVTQPSEGDFKAFTAVCTHQGCLVESSSDGTIPCPCHGSTFSLEDGSPQSGPAGSALAAVDITVDGDSITLA